MYDFQLQEEMLNISIDLLNERGIAADYALGGGTALSAYYWQHRFSTDIDIFIHNGTVEDLKKIDPRKTSTTIKKQLKNIKYSGDLKMHPVYTELTIDQDNKMQFFVVKDRTSVPYSPVTLWGKDIFVESVEEIIAKKVYYRCGNANARDLFDLTVAIYKDPTVLMSINVPKEKLEILLDSINKITQSDELINTYKLEIEMMSPAEQYTNIATNYITYLNDFLSSYLGALDMGIESTIGIEGMKEFCEELRVQSFS